MNINFFRVTGLICLYAFCNFAYAQSSDPNQNSIYECRKDSDGKTRCVRIRGALREEVDLSIESAGSPELLALSRTLKTGQPTPIITDERGAIPQCGSGHGQSACCRIIAGGGDLTYTECGSGQHLIFATRQGLKTSRVPAWFNPSNPAPQCGGGHGQTACCHWEFCPIRPDDILCEDRIVCE